ncbi:MAG TPA: photosynthetic reaction center cytochrome c subunit family protein, partial [Gemmatimonadaceae bacterium]
GAGPGGGGGGPPLNYALDTKDQKKTARVMLKMVDSINKVFLATVPTRDMASPISVTCYTCHRGVAKPMTIDAVLASSLEKFGVDTAIARYRALRTDVAAGRYNFTEQPVTIAAQRLAAAGKYDDAMKLLQMNLEYNPTSPNLDYEIADVMINKGDKDAGIARLRAILAKNPNDRRARARLTQLGATPTP